MATVVPQTTAKAANDNSSSFFDNAIEVEELINVDELIEIYRIDGIGKTYVGLSKLIGASGKLRGSEVRFPEHTYKAKKGLMVNCSRLLGEAIRIHGEGNFTVQQIEVVHQSQGAIREIHWINHLGTVHPDGYNLMGGRDGHYIANDESKALSSRSLRTYGAEGHRNYTATVVKVTVPNCVGYRGYHNGIPKGFFGNSFSTEEKRSMALQWHLFGEFDYEHRLPRARIHADPSGNPLPTGVKYVVGLSKPYRSYHPQRQFELKSPWFATVVEAAQHVKLLCSFPIHDTPQQYYVVKRNPEDEKDPYMLYIKPRKHAKGTLTVEKGTLVGYEVDIPKDQTVNGIDAYHCFLKTEYALEQNLADAIQYRSEYIKPDVLVSPPDWVHDLPPPQKLPDMTYIWPKPKSDPIGYEVNLRNDVRPGGTKSRAFTREKGVTLEDNLQSAFAFRIANIKPGVLSEDAPKGQMHPAYMKHTLINPTPDGRGWKVDISKGSSNNGLRQSKTFTGDDKEAELQKALAFRAEWCKPERLPKD